MCVSKDSVFWIAELVGLNSSYTMHGEHARKECGDISEDHDRPFHMSEWCSASIDRYLYLICLSPSCHTFLCMHARSLSPSPSPSPSPPYISSPIFSSGGWQHSLVCWPQWPDFALVSCGLYLHKQRMCLGLALDLWGVCRALIHTSDDSWVIEKYASI